jgi:hypothetical protein
MLSTCFEIPIKRDSFLNKDLFSFSLWFSLSKISKVMEILIQFGDLLILTFHINIVQFILFDFEFRFEVLIKIKQI